MFSKILVSILLILFSQKKIPNNPINKETAIATIAKIIVWRWRISSEFLKLLFTNTLNSSLGRIKLPSLSSKKLDMGWSILTKALLYCWPLHFFISFSLPIKEIIHKFMSSISKLTITITRTVSFLRFTTSFDFIDKNTSRVSLLT